jgi:hypothetical protein
VPKRNRWGKHGGVGGPLPGMLLHIDASKHAGFGDGATGTWSPSWMMPPARSIMRSWWRKRGAHADADGAGGDRRTGSVLRLYNDRASHLFVTPQAGRQGG